ncbi:MAG TPA: PaaI family thioesterase [Alphaproteobacteria bacterium]|jgi:uncharacterized protein (TIGR00369 family)|nr:PaaI family thioesterase [Alphaproteobacteria bacterium]
MDHRHQTTVAWTDPAVLYAAHKQLSSIDLFRAVRDGKVPLEPAMCLLGAKLTKVAPGEIVMEMMPAEQHLDHTGVVQPGILAALTDTAAGYAIHTRVPLGVRCATLEMQVSFMEPVTLASGRIKVVGRATRIGSRTATCEAKVLDSAGNLCSLMTATFIVLPPDLS